MDFLHNVQEVANVISPQYWRKNHAAAGRFVADEFYMHFSVNHKTDYKSGLEAG